MFRGDRFCCNSSSSSLSMMVLRSPIYIYADEPSEYIGMFYRTSNRILNNGINVIISFAWMGFSIPGSQYRTIRFFARLRWKFTWTARLHTTILEERKTLRRRNYVIMVGSPSKKIVANMKYLPISWELLVFNMVIPYPTWTIIISTLSILSENVDIELQVRNRHANEHTAQKRLRGDILLVEKRRWRSLLECISTVYLFRH